MCCNIVSSDKLIFYQPAKKIHTSIGPKNSVCMRKNVFWCQIISARFEIWKTKPLWILNLRYRTFLRPKSYNLFSNRAQKCEITCLIFSTFGTLYSFSSPCRLQCTCMKEFYRQIYGKLKMWLCAFMQPSYIPQIWMLKSSHLVP